MIKFHMMKVLFLFIIGFNLMAFEKGGEADEYIVDPNIKGAPVPSGAQALSPDHIITEDRNEKSTMPSSLDDPSLLQDKILEK